MTSGLVTDGTVATDDKKIKACHLVQISLPCFSTWICIFNRAVFKADVCSNVPERSGSLLGIVSKNAQ